MIKGLSIHLNCHYADVDEVDRCIAAAQDGFRCVEMWAPPRAEVAGHVITELERHHLSLASINTWQGPRPDDFGVVSEPDAIESWREHFRATLSFARLANSQAINVLVGGRRPSATKLTQRRCLLDNLDWALSLLRPDDPILLLEPLNAADRKSPLLHSVDRALGVIAELGNPSRLLLLFDAYHLFQEEDDVISALRRSAHRIGHVQVADYPGRAEPGSGEVPIGRLLAELAQTSYSGWVGLEYFPSGREPSPFSWLLDHESLDDRLLRGLAS